MYKYVDDETLQTTLETIRDRLAISDKTEAQALTASVSYPNCVYYTSDTHNLVKDGKVISAGIGYGTVDSTSTSTAFTATVPGITELKDGIAVLLRNNKVTSASGFTININGLGAKPAYNSMETSGTPTRDTTIFNIKYTMLFIYSSTIVSGGGWICYRGYNKDTTYSSMSQTEANTGTATTARTITAKVLRDTINAHIPTATTTRIGGALVAEVNEGTVSELSSTGLSYADVIWRIDSNNKGYTKIPVLTSNEDTVGSTKNSVAYSAGYTDSLFARKAVRITITESSGTYSSDKTYDEIKTLVDAGQIVYAFYNELIFTLDGYSTDESMSNSNKYFSFCSTCYDSDDVGVAAELYIWKAAKTTGTNKHPLVNIEEGEYASTNFVETGLSGKQATLVSGTNIKTVNNNSLLGSGDISIQENVQSNWNSISGLSQILNKPFESLNLNHFNTENNGILSINDATLSIPSDWEDDGSPVIQFETYGNGAFDAEVPIAGRNMLGKLFPGLITPEDYKKINKKGYYTNQYFTIESLSDNNLIQFKNPQDPGGYNPNVGPWDEFTTRDIYYSIDDGLTWNVVEIRNWNTVYNITTLNTNEKVLLKSTSTYYSYGSGENGSNFITSDSYIIYGNIMSLLYDDSFINQTSFNTRTSDGYDVPLGKLFYNNTNLISAENLILPATTLTKSCYVDMFHGCTSLTKTPELPATTLVDSCYYQMFYGCTSLTKAPKLPATTLANYCYKGMFQSCISLNEIECLATDISATECTAYWVYNVASSGTFITADNPPVWTTGDSGIPTGWKVVIESNDVVAKKYDIADAPQITFRTW